MLGSSPPSAGRPLFYSFTTAEPHRACPSAILPVRPPTRSLSPPLGEQLPRLLAAVLQCRARLGGGGRHRRRVTGSRSPETQAEKRKAESRGSHTQKQRRVLREPHSRRASTGTPTPLLPSLRVPLLPPGVRMGPPLPGPGQEEC